MQKSRRSRKSLFAALTLFAATTISLAQSVEVTKVENHGGTATLTTNAPNSALVVTALDNDKKSIESWVVSSDEKGRALVPSGYNLSAANIRVRHRDRMPDVLVPTGCVEGEVAMFAVDGIEEGQVVDVKTLDGVVVLSSTADRFGRFVASSGLAIGTYLVAPRGGSPRTMTVGGDRAQQNIVPRALGKPFSLMLDRPLRHPERSTIRFQGAGQASTPVLASSSREAVASTPLNMGLAPGVYDCEILDSNGEVVQSQRVTIYEATAKLEHKRIASGSQTMLRVTVTPPVSGTVTVRLLNGPVRFARGGHVAVGLTSSGRADFAIQSDAGSAGKFQLAWDFSPVAALYCMPDDHGAEPVAKNPDGSAESTTVDELGEFAEGYPLQRRTKIKNWPDKRSEVTIELVDKNSGKVISGERVTTDHSGKEEKVVKTEKWDIDSETWVEDR